LHGEEDGGERCLGFNVEEFKGRDFGCVVVRITRLGRESERRKW